MEAIVVSSIRTDSVCVCVYPQSVIMPVYNASSWLDECLQGILQQDFTGSMELSVFDDASTVSTLNSLKGIIRYLCMHNIPHILEYQTSVLV